MPHSGLRVENKKKKMKNKKFVPPKIQFYPHFHTRTAAVCVALRHFFYPETSRNTNVRIGQNQSLIVIINCCILLCWWHQIQYHNMWYSNQLYWHGAAYVWLQTNYHVSGGRRDANIVTLAESTRKYMFEYLLIIGLGGVIHELCQ